MQQLFFIVIFFRFAKYDLVVLVSSNTSYKKTEAHNRAECMLWRLEIVCGNYKHDLEMSDAR